MNFVPPARLPEANVQAELYHQLRLRGIRALLEYRVNNCRFDLVIVNQDYTKVELIVEIKNYVNVSTPNMNNLQFKKYRAYGVPVLIVKHLEDVQVAADLIERYVKGLVPRNGLTRKGFMGQVFWF